MKLEHHIGNALVMFVVAALATNAVVSTLAYIESNKMKTSPYSEYFEYVDIKPEKNTYKVGEPLLFQSTRKSNGIYKLTFIDQIVCPTNPRHLIESATSYGSTKDDTGKAIVYGWTFGDYVPGQPFTPKTIKIPQRDCRIESLITADVGNGVVKSQSFTSKHLFNIEE